MGSIFNFTTDFDRVMNQDVSEINLPPLRESAEKACFIYIIFHGVSHGDETVYRSRLEPCSFFRRAIGLHIRPIAMTSILERLWRWTPCCDSCVSTSCPAPALSALLGGWAPL